jgi:Na+/H+ antiporter NhaC
MSSAGAQCDHLTHVSTQIPYALTVAGISFVMFIIAGFVQNIWICFPLGIVLTVATAFVLKMITKNPDMQLETAKQQHNRPTKNKI